MNTPSHVILNLALLGRRSQSHSPIFWGALLPDLGMFGFYGWAKLVAKLDEATIWSEVYYQPGWQTFFDIGNSIPLALLVIAIALGLRRRRQSWQAMADGVILLATSVIFHCLADLPLHVDDGHRHLWPLSNFRFESPVSYWDPNHHGVVMALVELLLVLGASVWVWRLLRSRWAKVLLMVSNVLMGLVYVRFYLIRG